MSTAKKTSELPKLKPNHSLKMYLDLLVERIKTKQYFDYDFVTQFTKPNCVGIHTVPITGNELIWAEKIFRLYDGETRNCDDILVLLLDHLKENGFIGKYKYIGPDYEPDDEGKLCPVFKGKSFFNIFLGHVSLKHIAATKWEPYIIKSEVLSYQYIDNNGFFLSVGNWDIAIATDACDFSFELFDRFVIFQDYKTKELYMKDNTTGVLKSLRRRKTWGPQMIEILVSLIENEKLSINVYEVAKLFRIDEFEIKSSRNAKTSTLSNQVRSMKHILKEDFGIDEWERFFTFEDNTLTLTHKVSKKDYCGVKR